MRVTFPRLPDHEWGYATIERDDGVAHRLWAGRTMTHVRPPAVILRPAGTATPRRWLPVRCPPGVVG